MSIVSQKEQVLTQEELKVLEDIQTQTQQLIMDLGEIELIRLQLEERKENTKAALNKIKESENTFTENILEKYGSVSINPQTGEITKIESK